MKIAHLINVTEITESKKRSYLHIAQPLTMKSMVIAKNRAKPFVEIQLLAVKHKMESVEIPPDFQWTKDLERYAWEELENLNSLPSKRPLPLLKDIIKELYESSNAEYFVYTNLDIGLFPEFYIKVKEKIDSGYDAFCINRRDMPKEDDGVTLDQRFIDKIYGMEGKPHPGIDCFVFRRSIVPLLDLGNVFIGYPPIGQVLKSQIDLNSKNSAWLKDEILTFHIGNDQGWMDKDPYYLENCRQGKGLYEGHFRRGKKGLISMLKRKIKPFFGK